jgi:hypothetical protein
MVSQELNPSYELHVRFNISPVIASEGGSNPGAKKKDWIASSQELLAMTELAIPIQLKAIML